VRNRSSYTVVVAGIVNRPPSHPVGFPIRGLLPFSCVSWLFPPLAAPCPPAEGLRYAVQSVVVPLPCQLPACRVAGKRA